MLRGFGVGLAVVSLACSSVNAATFAVKDGAEPWHDRAGKWQLADIPAALQSDDPVPQQACAARGLTVPKGTKAIVLAMGKHDAAQALAKGIPLRATDLGVTVRSPDGKHKLAYGVFVYHEPPEKVTFGGVCRAGVVLLRLNDDGIKSRVIEPPAPLVPPEKSLAEREKFHLYLLIGQSNMAGRGPVESEDLAINPRVLTLDKENRWVVAVDPIHFDKPGMAGVGLGTTFGKIMAKQNPDVVIGLIPCAVGGTGVWQWQKGAKPTGHWGVLYDNAVARAKTALHDGVLKGILWHQGEADSSTRGIAAYEGKLTKLILDLKADLGIGDLPFVAGELGVWDPEKHGGRNAFNENLQALPNWIPNSAVVDSDGLAHKGDNTHFGSAALREFGKRYAKAMTDLQAAAKP